jgi:dTDP-4-amino-4,6-dideoxygalactose transaminase
MKVLNNHVVSRRAMHDFYLDLFEDVEGITVFSVPNEDFHSNYWLTTILIDSEKNNTLNRETIRLALEEENIESRPLWKPMHLQRIFKNYPYYGSNIAQSLFENGLCLPSGSNLTAMERAKIKKTILKLWQK